MTIMGISQHGIVFAQITYKTQQVILICKLNSFDEC